MTLRTRTDTIKRSWKVSFFCVFAYFVSQKFRDSCRLVANVRFQILNLRSFHSRPTFFLTGFLICSSRLPLPKNLHRPLIYRTGRPWDSSFQCFTFFHCAFWPTKRRVEAMWFMVCHELVIQSHNYTMIIITIIPRATPCNAFLHLQIHLSDKKLKLSH